jgi:hypothetical protein
MRIRTARIGTWLVTPFLLAALLVGAPALATTQRWSVLMMGNPAGNLTLDRQGSRLRTHFEYNDRGRGPSIDSTIELAADGTPRALTAAGVEYYKGKVQETLTTAGGSARWQNRA